MIPADEARLASGLDGSGQAAAHPTASRRHTPRERGTLAGVCDVTHYNCETTQLLVFHAALFLYHSQSTHLPPLAVRRDDTSSWFGVR